MLSTDDLWLGIDFGTCSTSAAVLVGHALRQVNLSQSQFAESADMPTAVFVEADGRMLVGHQAVRARLRDVSRFMSEFKLEIERTPGRVVSVGGALTAIPWRDIVASVLRHVKAVAEKNFNNGSALERVVLTVPALYAQGGIGWNIMEQAATLAGFKDIRVIREPHAAAVYYDYLLREAGQPTGTDGELVLVYDLGGGTFDPALIRRQGNHYPIERAEGSGTRCGGVFFDEELRKDFKRKCPEFVTDLAPPQRSPDGTIHESQVGRARSYARAVIEIDQFLTDCKHGFSQPDLDAFDEPAPSPSERNYRVTRAEFDSLLSSLLDSTIDCCDVLLRGAGVGWRDLSRVILVGGSCSLPVVRDKIAAAMGRAGADRANICWQRITGTNIVIDPRLAVSRGASCVGGMKDQSQIGVEVNAVGPVLAKPADHPKASFDVSFAVGSGNPTVVIGLGGGRSDQGDPPNSFEALKGIDLMTGDQEERYVDAMDPVNIVVTGSSGVGKSTLINAVFGKNIQKAGKGLPQTTAIKKISDPALPMSLYDTQGLEILDSQKTIAAIKSFVEGLRNTIDASEQIHAVWLCLLEGSNRVEGVHLDLLKLFKAYDIPCIVVLTQAQGNDEFLATVKELTAPQSVAAVVPVMASPFVTKYANIPAQGLESLVDETLRILPESRKKAFDYCQRADWNRKLTAARQVVNWASAAGVAAAAIPIPGGSSLALIGIETTMLLKINQALGVSIDKTEGKSIVMGIGGVIAASVGGKMLFAEALTLLPGVGTVAGAALKAGVALPVIRILGALYIDVVGDLVKNGDGLPKADAIVGLLKKAFEARKARYVAEGKQ